MAVAEQLTLESTPVIAVPTLPFGRRKPWKVAFGLGEEIGRPDMFAIGVVAVEIPHLDILHMDMAAGRDVGGGEADDLVVFADLGAGGDAVVAISWPRGMASRVVASSPCTATPASISTRAVTTLSAGLSRMVSGASDMVAVPFDGARAGAAAGVAVVARVSRPRLGDIGRPQQEIRRLGRAPNWRHKCSAGPSGSAAR